MGELKLDLEKTVLGDLSRLPQILNDKATELLLLKNQLEELKFNIKHEENRVMREIENDLDPMGKPIFSNVSKRQAENESRLKGNVNYQQNLLSMGNIKVKIDNLTLQHQFCQNKFTAAKSMSRLISGE